MKMTIALLAFALAIPAFAAGNPDCTKEDHYPLISKSDLAAVAAKKEATIVDVNSQESFAKAHVPNAINYGANEKNFVKMLPTDKTALVVAYCGDVKCSAWKSAAEKACEAGYTNVKHFKEGIKGWVASNPAGLQ